MNHRSFIVMFTILFMFIIITPAPVYADPFTNIVEPPAGSGILFQAFGEPFGILANKSVSISTTVDNFYTMIILLSTSPNGTLPYGRLHSRARNVGRTSFHSWDNVTSINGPLLTHFQVSSSITHIDIHNDIDCYIESISVIIMEGETLADYPGYYLPDSRNITLIEVVEHTMNHTIYENVTVYETITEYIDFRPALLTTIPIIAAEVIIAIFILYLAQKRRTKSHITYSSDGLFDDVFGENE